MLLRGPPNDVCVPRRGFIDLQGQANALNCLNCNIRPTQYLPLDHRGIIKIPELPDLTFRQAVNPKHRSSVIVARGLKRVMLDGGVSDAEMTTLRKEPSG